MGKRQGISLKTQGTSLLTRDQDALKQGYFGIDERSLSDLMAFTTAFAKYVPFTNLENKIDGNWLPFFENNLAFLLAIISRTDIDQISEKFKKEVRYLDHHIDAPEEKEKLGLLIGYTAELFELINEWYVKAKHDLIHLEENTLAEHLHNAISLKLNAQLKSLKSLLVNLQGQNLLQTDLSIDFSNYDPIWISESKSKLNNDQKKEIANFEQALTEVSKVHKAVFGVITYLKSIAPSLLNQVLEDYPYHAPQISLFLSFLKSFQNVQDDVNKVVHRHLDYYYFNVLKQTLRPSSPDSAHVYFVPSDHIIKENIPRGTLLTAGTDEDGLDYTYETDHPIELNLGMVTDLKIIHVASNPLIGLGSPYRSVSNIYARSIHLDEYGHALDQFNNPIAFDTFGKDQSEISYIHRNMDQASVGFAIASSIFLLSEGKRKIAIKYKFSLKSMSSLILFIEELTKSSRQTKEQKEKDGHQNRAVEEANVLSPQSAFHQILVDVFKVKITTAKGWYETDKYEILPPKTWTDGEVPINLLLDISAPPIAGYDEETHGSGFSTKWPVIQFVLTSERAMYAYTYLRDLIIEKCTIEVKVDQVKDLQVFNDLGKLDINKPFTPFGNTQEMGSYFLVGNEEIFRKKLSDLSFDIQWHNLPKLKGGFEAYYKQYANDIKTADFKVAVTGLSEFQFHPLDKENAQEVNLFKKNDKQDELVEKVKIDQLQLEKFQIKPNYLEMNLDDYNSQTRSGFLKFEITGPTMGFGQPEYPKLFAEAVMENAKVSLGILPSSSKKKVEMPNEPYIPQIRSISMSYAASTSISMHQNDLGENEKLSGDQVYHILPFGKLIVFDEGLPVKNHLLPQFNNEGYLFLGLENLQPPVELALYFELEDNVENNTTHTDIPQIKWKYLVSNSWVAFEEQEFISDSTNNFVTSGIVRLKVPSAINKKHDILEDGKYWLSAAVPKNTKMLSKMALIHTNGVKATWKPHKTGEEWKQSIDKGTIASFLTTRPEVSEVVQPFPSFGGRVKETAKEFYTRVSERLRHKNRCVVPTDFERVILDQFPFLFQVKCISSFSHPEFVKRGSIKIIVVPKLGKTPVFYEPKVDYNQLDEITTFVKKIVSPFAHIEIINPVYERVRVSGKVRLKGDLKSGEFVKQVEQDLRKYICPWFSKNQQEMSFGGSIERDDILSYLESLDYIRFVTKLSVIIIHNNEGKYSLSDSASDEGRANELTSTAPWSVLTSDTSHDIDLTDKSVSETPQQTRIDTMKIGTDFVIIEEEEEEMEFPAFKIEDDTYYMIDIDI